MALYTNGTAKIKHRKQGLFDFYDGDIIMNNGNKFTKPLRVSTDYKKDMIVTEIKKKFRYFMDNGELVYDENFTNCEIIFE